MGFDLDTKRPFFKSRSAGADWIDSQVPAYSFNSVNFNKLGDPMLLPLDFESAAGCDIGTFRFTQSGTLYWFRVRDVFVNSSNRTEISYDVDHMMSFVDRFGRGHVLRVPEKSPMALSVPMNPKEWTVDGTVQVSATLVSVGFVLTQMKSSPSSGYDISGPVFCLMRCTWTSGVPGTESFVAYNPIADLASRTQRFALSDVVNAWLVPMPVDFSAGILRYWNNEGSSAAPVFEWGWTVAAPLATWSGSISESPPAVMVDTERESHPSPVPGSPIIGTDSTKGKLTVFVDELGNVLWSVPEFVDAHARVWYCCRMSMSSFEIDISLTSAGMLRNHPTNKGFTYLCRSLDVICDSWAEYLFRQRESDIDARKLQNQQALAQGLAGAGTGAVTGALTGAVAGSVVPGVGTVIGAVGGALMGGVGQAASAGVQYGVSKHYAEKEQGISDSLYKLAQDTVSVGGMNTTYAIAVAGGLIRMMQLSVDAETMESIAAEIKILGVPADKMVENVFEVMSELMNSMSFRPFRANAEVDNASIPSAWKRAATAQLAAGAMFKKFGVW